ncbi:DUF6702 family protein [Aureliella helgolandensis]|nr:DUF6702 family protein [Aureliella helgolandensis]
MIAKYLGLSTVVQPCQRSWFTTAIARIVVGVCGVWMLTSTVLAHPFHISTAEMEFNKKSGRWEIALKLQAVDVEQSLSAQLKRKINLEKEARIDELLTAYLSGHFYLAEQADVLVARENSEELQRDVQSPATNEGAKADAAATSGEGVASKLAENRSSLHWVGKELDTNWLWVYFEITPLKDSGQPQVLVNSVLVDWTSGQINTVSVRNAGKRTALKMTAKQPWAKFSKAWAEN